MDTIVINIKNIAGSSFCVDSDDGQIIYDQICKAVKLGKKVELSFKNVEMLTSAFLNTAVGQLYRDFSEEQIKKSLSVSDMENEDRELLKQVTDTAKTYYKNPEKMMESVRKILGVE